MGTPHVAFRTQNTHREDVRIAKQLCYPRIVIEKLKEEKDPNKRSRILTDARLGKYDN